MKGKNGNNDFEKRKDEFDRKHPQKQEPKEKPQPQPKEDEDLSIDLTEDLEDDDWDL